MKKSKSAYIGSILLIISAFLPSLDVLSKWLIPGMEEMRDSRGVLVTVDIWIATLYFAPVLLIIANFFKPNPKLYFFPLCMFFYAGSVYFSPVFGNEVNYLKLNSWLFFLGSILGALCFIFMLRYVRRLNLLEDTTDSLLEDASEEFTRLKQENKNLREKLNK